VKCDLSLVIVGSSPVTDVTSSSCRHTRQWHCLFYLLYFGWILWIYGNWRSN